MTGRRIVAVVRCPHRDRFGVADGAAESMVLIPSDASGSQVVEFLAACPSGTEVMLRPEDAKSIVRPGAVWWTCLGDGADRMWGNSEEGLITTGRIWQLIRDMSDRDSTDGDVSPGGPRRRRRWWR